MSDYTPAEVRFIETLSSSYEEKYPDLARENHARAVQRYRAFRDAMAAGTWTPEYDYWRHGGSYVTNIVYPSGAVGCIASARHTMSGKFEIACPPSENDEKFATRDAAARAEAVIALAQWDTILAEPRVFDWEDGFTPYFAVLDGATLTEYQGFNDSEEGTMVERRSTITPRPEWDGHPNAANYTMSDDFSAGEVDGVAAVWIDGRGYSLAVTA